jgi:hypothetical protein
MRTGAPSVGDRTDSGLLLSGRRRMGVAGGEVSLLLRAVVLGGGRIVAGRSSLGALSDARGGVMSELLLDAAGRRRSPATLPEFHGTWIIVAGGHR